MTQQNIHIWVWIQNNRVIKAILNSDMGILKIYDEDDNLILKRTGLNKIQIKEVEECIIKYGAKKIDGQTQSFRYL